MNNFFFFIWNFYLRKNELWIKKQNQIYRACNFCVHQRHWTLMHILFFFDLVWNYVKITRWPVQCPLYIDVILFKRMLTSAPIRIVWLDECEMKKYYVCKQKEWNKLDKNWEPNKSVNVLNVNNCIY